MVGKSYLVEVEVEEAYAGIKALFALAFALEAGKCGFFQILHHKR
jgi:hypothetical protein